MLLRHGYSIFPLSFCTLTCVFGGTGVAGQVPADYSLMGVDLMQVPALVKRHLAKEHHDALPLAGVRLQQLMAQCVEFGAVRKAFSLAHPDKSAGPGTQAAFQRDQAIYLAGIAAISEYARAQSVDDIKAAGIMFGMSNSCDMDPPGLHCVCGLPSKPKTDALCAAAVWSIVVEQMRERGLCPLEVRCSP